MNMLIRILESKTCDCVVKITPPYTHNIINSNTRALVMVFKIWQYPNIIYHQRKHSLLKKVISLELDQRSFIHISARISVSSLL